MSRPPVLLLHGLARTRVSMAGMARFLEGQGYRTFAHTYPSRRHGVAELAEQVAEVALRELGPGPIDAVTHSLGGVLARQMAGMLPLRRVVMLAPPNAGSDLARTLEGFGPFSWLYGPAGRDVARAEGWPDAIRCEVGVIAGTRAPSLGNPVSWLSRGIGVFGADRPSDGTVAVDETHLPGMTDFATVHASHTWIMNHPEARQMVQRFLEHGRFAEVGPR
ncbi:MAG: hypothetical protein RIT45_3134 [Pseudomonadota bacterium]|jgi:pimeloyl-ACP methyl ester carboxylesterase